ncbi:MAG TPA: AAA family ATPase [Streptosporangiaceae bacterium]
MELPPGTLTTATVLFTDIVNSTATRSRLGEERADQHFERVYRLLRGVVEAGGAIFTKSLGDGLMAVFESATAGLDAITAVERALIADNRWAMEATSIHAALSSGDIRWQEDDISGQPYTEAARLVEIAGGGQVLCTDVVRRLARDRGQHEFREVSGPAAGGLPGNTRTWELLWQHADDRSEWLAPWLAGGHMLPFVGRERELAVLDGALDATRSRMSLVILQGDPGVGKTRLVSVVAQRARKKGFTVLAGRCTDPARLPYEPLAAAIDRLAGTSAALLLRAGVDQECGQLVRLAPSLSAPPLSLSVPSVPEPAAQRHQLTAVSERHQLVAAVRTFFERLAMVRPVLLIIDDLHAATTESLQLLRALLWDTEKLPVLIVATSRPVPDMVDATEADQEVLELHELQALGRVVPVPPFRLDDVTAALSSVTGDAATIEREEAARLHRVTGGNAFLVTEVLRDLAGAGSLDRLAVPDSVTRMVRERLSRLSRDARQLVNVLAVGEQLTSAALRTAMDVDHLTFLAAAEEVLATGLVSMPPSGWCQFSHELTRTAIYDGLSSPRAGMLHGRVADALRASEPQIMETRPYVVATHLLAAAERDRDPERTAEAVAAVERAAEDASERLAYGEAVAWYRRLVQLLEDGSAAPAERLAEALVRCGRAMWLAGDPQARETLVRAAELAEGTDRKGLIVEAALAGDRGFYSRTARPDPQRIDLLTRARELVEPADVRTRALLNAQLAAELTWATDSHRRFALSDEAVALARRSGDPRTIVSVLGSRSFTVIPAEPLERRIEYGKEMLEAARRTGDDLALFHATFQLIPVALDTGDFVRVAESLERAEELAQRLAQPHFVWLVKMCRTGQVIMRGDIAGAERASTEMLGMGTAIGHRLEAIAFYAEQIGEIRRLQGRLGELRDRLRQQAQAPQVDPVHAVLRYLCELDDAAAGPLLNRILDEQGIIPPENLAQRSALDNLAFAACRLGRRELIQPLYEALEPQAETFGISAVAHHCGHHYLALLSAASGAVQQAIDHFAAAARVHERCGAPLLMAESLLDWAGFVERTHAGGLDPAALRRRCAELLNGHGAVLLERRLAREGG